MIYRFIDLVHRLSVEQKFAQILENQMSVFFQICKPSGDLKNSLPSKLHSITWLFPESNINKAKRELSK